MKLSYQGRAADRTAVVAAIGLTSEPRTEKFEVPEDITAQLARFKAGNADRQSAEWLGGRLFEALFPLSIRESWRRYQDFMLADSILRLRLDIHHPSLASIPWEMLHDGGSPLVMSPRNPIVRGRPRRRPPVPLRRETCLRILLVTSSADRPEPSADQEAALIRDTLRPLAGTGAITVEVLESPSERELRAKLPGFDALHYVGGGDFTRGTGTIMLRDAAMGTQPISGKRLAEILLGTAVRLLILSAGENAIPSRVDSLMRVAQSVLTADLPAVVTMQGVMAQELAAEFAAAFYGGLASGEQLETCIIEGRRAIAAGRPERADWAMPVLFTDLPDGILWELASGARAYAPSGRSVSGRTAGALDQPRQTTLIVRSRDELAALELADSTGRRLSTAQGNLVATGLSPGFYRARLLSPGSAPVEELIDLEEGEARDVRLSGPAAPPSRLAGTLMANAGLAPGSDGYLNVSDTVGLVAGAPLTTLLTLAAHAVNTDRLWGDRLAGLGLRSFRDMAGTGAASGLQLILAIEASTARESVRQLSATSVRLWRETDPIPEPHAQLQLVEPGRGIAEFAAEGQPGPYWLSLEMPGSDPVVFAVALLPGRLTVVIVQQDELGGTRVLQYMPGLAGDEQAEPTSADEHARASMLRRLELMQRFAMSGQLDHALMNARELFHAQWEEPIAALLSGYLMLRWGDGGEFLARAGRLVDRFGELSDSHVLIASAVATTGGDHHRAESEFRAALDQGLPIVGDGLGLLAEGVGRYGIKHSRVPLLSAVFRRHIPGLLWSAWRPQALTAGAMLVKA